jgi:HSP20 family protein
MADGSETDSWGLLCAMLLAPQAGKEKVMAFGVSNRRERRDPWLETLLDFRKGFDEIFGKVYPYAFEEIPVNGFTWMPPVESFIEKGKYYIRLALPGVDPKQVNVEVKGNEVVIRGEKKTEHVTPPTNYLTHEFTYGQFQRVISMPEGVKPEALEATYTNGVLELTAPVTERALPRKIEIKGLSEPAVKKIAA